MKKSADEYRRAATSKTGVIDTNKLFGTKLPKISSKTTIVPEGKTMVLVMYLDWSGSMSSNLLTLWNKSTILLFCKNWHSFQSACFPVWLYNYDLEQELKDLLMIMSWELLAISNFLNYFRLAKCKVWKNQCNWFTCKYSL